MTSDGAHWKKQRDLLSKALRVEILEETADVAKRAADRLSVRIRVPPSHGGAAWADPRLRRRRGLRCTATRVGRLKWRRSFG